MKKFMIISVIDGEQVVAFFDNYVDVRQYAMDVVCGMGGVSHIYKFYADTKIYEILEVL